MSPQVNCPGLIRWAVLIAAVVGSFALTNSWSGRYGSPELAFAIAVPMAALCLVAALGLMAVAWRDDNGELGLFALIFTAASILPLTHALTIPGVLNGTNTTTTVSGVLAVPVGLLSAWPLLAPRSAVSARLGRVWRPWAAGWLVILGAGSGLLLASPDLLPVTDPSSAPIRTVGLVSLAALWGKGADFALGVLREHAGTQFDPRAVEWLAEVVDAAPDDLEPTVFAEIGRRHQPANGAVCDDCARIGV